MWVMSFLISLITVWAIVILVDVCSVFELEYRLFMDDNLTEKESCMHIVIGLLTTLAGLVWALHALQNAGFDLNSLSPFYYARRRKWQNTYGARPILNIDEPMTLGAVMVI